MRKNPAQHPIIHYCPLVAKHFFFCGLRPTVHTGCKMHNKYRGLLRDFIKEKIFNILTDEVEMKNINKNVHDWKINDSSITQ